MRRNTNFVNKLLNDLHHTSRYLSEAYIFDGQEDGPMGRDMDYDDEEGPMRRERPMQRGYQEQMPQQGNGDDNAEAQAMHAQEVIRHEPIIGKIRETAIEGLKKYADNPTSKLYEFFKKVFLESDKVLTDTGSKN